MLNKYIISIHSSKKSVYIFCKNGACIDCKSIYEECLVYLQNQRHNTQTHQESSTTTSTETDITLDEIQTYKFYVYLDSIHLQGSKEIESNPLFFGELDSKGEFIESKPIYHLIGEVDSSSIESTSNNRDSINTESNNSLSTLQVFLGSNTLTLLNYSLLDSSLNIKLECNSKESKAILEKEQIQREQIQRDSNSIDSLTSTSMLHPILEDNEIKCPHNGVVQLKSNKGKSFISKMDSPCF